MRILCATTELDADLRLAQQETQGLRLQLQAESLYRGQLETMLAEAQEEKKGQICVPAMLEAINWLSQLSEEALHAAIALRIKQEWRRVVSEERQ